MNLLVSEQAFVQALIKEIVVENDDFVNRFNLFEIVLEFVEIRLKHFE